MTSNKVNAINGLKTLYAGLQGRLQAGLLSSQAAVNHPGAKGTETEANWLDLLQNHLPRRYQAETAFVVDSEGEQSDQLDIVIYDRQYTPELYNVVGQKVIPAEGVYAVFEVRQALNKSNIEYAGEKIASVRNLNRTSAPIVHAGGEHTARDLTPILGGILATSSDWSPAFGTSFTESLRKREFAERLDIGCVANDGAFDVIYNDNGLEVDTCPAENALAFFFLTLLHRLQRIGTVPAIQYDAYLRGF